MDFPVVNKERAFAIVDVMRPIALEHGVSVAQVALAWLLSRRAVSSVIIGAKNIDQLQDNIASTKLTLTPANLDVLDDASKLPPEYPGWMMAMQAQYRSTPPVKD